MRACLNLFLIFLAALLSGCGDWLYLSKLDKYGYSDDYPKAFDNLLQWYDAQRLNLPDGALVTSWPDLGPLGRTVVDTGGAPSFQKSVPELAGKSGVYFAPLSSHWLNYSGSFSKSPSFTMMAVFIYNGVNMEGAFGYSDGPSDNTKWGLGADSSRHIAYWISDGANVSNGIGSVVPVGATLAQGRYEASSSSNFLNLWIDSGFQSASMANGGPYAFSNAGTLTTFRIGQVGTDGATVFHGTIAEVLIYDRALTDIEMNKLRCFFKWKYPPLNINCTQ